MVLFIFVTMMLHQGQKSLDQEHSLFHLSSSFGPFILASVLLIELIYVLNTFSHGNLANQDSQGDFTIHHISIKHLGATLYGSYQLLVVLAALLLLCALIGAIHVARRQSVVQGAVNKIEDTAEQQADEATPLTKDGLL